ncbi:uroporphyrinogen-III synthase [Methylocapsa sp. S129]|uniref:uroporphyrinogen-III synthase n=1 Tax=Methylocapsa sp. S129 TaxID=1641869 RepID=UPI00352A124D
MPETRELDLFTTMLRERGAIPIPCPLVAIRDAPDPAPVEEWLRRFIARPGDDLILLTGEGLRRLAGVAERAGIRDSFVAALRPPRKITRGPKPVRALREIGLDADLTAPTPTSAGVVEALAAFDLTGRRVGVQLYPDGDHQPLLGFLSGAGAQADAVLPYVYASEADDERVLGIIAQIAAGEIDAIAFTSSPQVRRFFQVAAKDGRVDAAREGLERILVAAIGPVVAGELAAFGVRADVMPANETYFMKPLVRELGEAFATRDIWP